MIKLNTFELKPFIHSLEKTANFKALYMLRIGSIEVKIYLTSYVVKYLLSRYS